MSNIHSSTVIEDGAMIGDNVTIGPFCHVGSQVVIHDGVTLRGHVALHGDTQVGAGTTIFPFAAIGGIPQDLKYHGEAVRLTIGERCIIREGVTMNPGTEGGGFLTSIGNDCAFLANAHVAHDCHVGNNVIFSNNVMIAGHCEVGDHAILGGGAAVHQFSRIGHHSFIGGMAAVEGDLIPFGMAVGNRAWLSGLNLIGMKRAGIDREAIHAVRAAYKLLFSGERPVREIAAEMASGDNHPLVSNIAQFITATADRALCTPQSN